MKTDRWVWVPFEVDKKYDGFRIDRFLAQRLVGYSRTRVQGILSAARVLKEKKPAKANSKVHTGDTIEIAYQRRPEAAPASDAAIPVLYEDDDLVLVNKPGDLLSHPTDKIVDHTVLGLLRHCRPDLPKLHLLHRLDRETSGILALAKNYSAARAWTRDTEAHRIRKEYVAIVHGEIRPAEGVISDPIGPEGGEIRVRQWINVPGAVPALTRYATTSSPAAVSGGSIDGNDGSRLTTCRDDVISVVRVFPETGRLHQIRVHLASMGHPILGDPLYTGSGEVYRKMVDGTATPSDRAKLGFPRVALHAAALTFPHPRTGQERRIEAPLPIDLEKYMRRMKPIRDYASKAD